MKHLLITGLAVAFLSSCALIPTPHTIGDVEFAGCVYENGTDIPVDNASVMISYPSFYSNDLYKYVGEVKSNEEGCFIFKSVPEFSMQPLVGPVTVNVYAAGYKTAFVPLREIVGKTNYKIYLEQ